MAAGLDNVMLYVLALAIEAPSNVNARKRFFIFIGSRVEFRSPLMKPPSGRNCSSFSSRE
jgi:hypothetical protein